jgi:leucyl aminopeptidase
MHIEWESEPYFAAKTDALVTYMFDKDDHLEGMVAELDKRTGGKLRILAESGELTGKSLEAVVLHFPPGLTARRLLIIGAGKKDKFSRADLRRIASVAVRRLMNHGVKDMVFLAREDQRDAADAQAIVEGAISAEFESDKYRAKKDGQQKIERMTLAGFDSAHRPAIESAIVRARAVGESVNFGRDLINEPSNYLTPGILAEKAEAMARQCGLSVEILDEKRITELKMGALLGVAQGSSEPPRMIVLTYTPARERPGAPVLGLIGKAITFDTGGISIKPAAGMEKMKYDMGGGGTMLSVMRALSFLKPSVKVIAVISSAENMPGSRAQKPGDVKIAMSGKSIEVINTDAEGRMVLADGITYARQLGATHLIDAATLTGAIEVALGVFNVGAFGQPREYLDKFLDCARESGEKMWPMPLDDEYEEGIQSNIADIRNTGSGRGGGAITAAWFLKEFAEDMPWIHLDIASTCWNDEAKPWAAKGPTGVAVRTIINFAMGL